MSALPRSIRAQQSRTGQLLTARSVRSLSAAESRELERLEVEAAHRAARAEARANPDRPLHLPQLNPLVLAEVGRIRADQARRFGHTAATDDLVPLDDWGLELRQRAKGLHETLQLGPRATARAQALRLIAHTFALVDRLDREAREPA